MDSYIEKATRKSEELIRKQNITSMMNWDHERKVDHSISKVNEFIDVLGLDKVYVSTSGGKDSACLSRLCKSIDPTIKHVMFNTGLEYAATIKLAESQGAEIVPPKTSWVKFCEYHGYPVGSKQVSRRIHDANNTPIGCVITMFSHNYGLPNKWLHFLDSNLVDFPISNLCCDEFKKRPAKALKLNPIIGTRIDESENRRAAWKKSGCNSYSLNYKHGVSKPISLWSSKDIEQFIIDEDIQLSEIYTQYNEKRTGCVNCPYGAHLDGSRFDLLKKIEPKRYEYFIHTKLRKILAMSNVSIITDDDYMEYKEQIQKIVQKWHDIKSSNDNYLRWKCEYAKEYFTEKDIKEAVLHISKNKLKYDLTEILSCIERTYHEERN